MRARLPLTLLCAVAAFMAPAAVADAAKKKTKYPSIKKVTPLNLTVGETLTIRGKGFRKGAWKNTVVFKRDKGRAIFAKARKASRRKLKVIVPAKLAEHLANDESGVLPTTFRLRILAKRFGKRYTKRSASPVIAAAADGDAGGGGAGAPGAPGAAGVPAPPPPDCDGDGVLDAVDDDDDNDLLTDGFEAGIGTDRCLADSDGDGMWDAWEYNAALDLNSRALPYPGKRPYPNARFGDSEIDFDGDGLYAWQEHTLWQKAGRPMPLNYSDGTQRSDAGSGLTDDNRDFDGDGLGNWIEANGPGQSLWWTQVYEAELPYPVPYASLDFVDGDSDGDGVLDGADDVDHDGYTNAQEISRTTSLGDAGTGANPGPRWVQPFNPCLPDPGSPTCSRHVPPKAEDRWEPFKTLGPPFITGYRLPLTWPTPATSP